MPACLEPQLEVHPGSADSMIDVPGSQSCVPPGLGQPAAYHRLHSVQWWMGGVLCFVNVTWTSLDCFFPCINVTPWWIKPCAHFDSSSSALTAKLLCRWRHMRHFKPPQIFLEPPIFPYPYAAYAAARVLCHRLWHYRQSPQKDYCALQAL